MGRSEPGKDRRNEGGAPNPSTARVRPRRRFVRTSHRRSLAGSSLAPRTGRAPPGTRRQPFCERRRTFGDNSFCGKSLRAQGRNKGRLSLLCTNAERIVVRIGRYVGCEADVKELRLFPQSIDDLTDQALSDARSCENLFVFRENVLRDESREGRVLKPVSEALGFRVARRDLNPAMPAASTEVSITPLRSSRRANCNPRRSPASARRLPAAAADGPDR